MDKFWIVTLFHFQPTENDRNDLESIAVEEFHTLGIGNEWAATHEEKSAHGIVNGA